MRLIDGKGRLEEEIGWDGRKEEYWKGWERKRRDEEKRRRGYWERKRNRRGEERRSGEDCKGRLGMKNRRVRV